MFEIPDTFHWSSPWMKIPPDYEVWPTASDSAKTPYKNLNDELHREMPEGHLLFGLHTKVVAVCTVTHKDFVFVTDDESKPIAIVHLTWSSETDPFWPYTQIFPSLKELEFEIRRWSEDDFWHK